MCVRIFPPTVSACLTRATCVNFNEFQNLFSIKVLVSVDGVNLRSSKAACRLLNRPFGSGGH